MLSGGPLDVEGQAACRMAYATFLRHGAEAHDATLLYHYYSLPPYFCSFVKMILFISEKDKEKKITPSSRAARIGGYCQGSHKCKQ